MHARADVPLRAEIQGVSADLTTATGSYDMINLGALSPGRLAEILAAMTRLAVPESSDVCYPNLTISWPSGKTWFAIQDDTGALFGEDGQTPVTIAEAIAKVTGQPYTGIIPAHRSAAPRPAAAPAVPASSSPAAVTPAAAVSAAPAVQDTVPADPAAAELAGLLNAPVGLAEYRRRFPYLLNGPEDAEFKRLVPIIEAGSLAPELKARLTKLPPRYWALRHPGIMRRLFALALDLVMYVVFMAIGVNMFDQNNSGGIAVWFGISLLVYFIGTEWLFSASPAGVLTGLRVVNRYGGRPSIWLCIGRQFSRVFRVFLIFLAGKVSSGMSTSGKMAMGATATRVGGVGGGEVVVR